MAAVSVPYEVDTLDPHARNRLSNFATLSNVYEPLVTTDSSMAIRPCLAERWDNPDLATWVFHLRPGVLFHDGTPLDAGAVVATFDRLLGSRGLEIAGYVSILESVRALDARTVEIRTRSPMAILLNKLRFVVILPKGATPESLAASPSGTGPYRLAGWKAGKEITFSRNEAYWGPKPALSTVTYRLGRSPEEAFGDLREGTSQLVQGNSRRLAKEAAAREGTSVLRSSSIFVKYLAYDFQGDPTPHAATKRNPFKDLRVRQALSLAVDRQRLVKDLETQAVPASQGVPPFIFGFNPSLPALSHDAARARELLREAGYPDGFRAKLHVRRLFEDAARGVALMLADAGIVVEVVPLGDPEFFSLLRSHGVSLFISRFGCPTGDASDIFENTLHTVDEGRHYGENNLGRYSNLELDSLIEESATILDMQKRRPLLQRVMSQMMEDLVWIPLYVDQDIYAVHAPFTYTPRNDNFVLASEIGVR